MLKKEKLSLIGSNSPCARVQPLPAAPGDALHPTALRPGVSPQSHHDKCFIKASCKGSKHSSLTSCATRSSSWASSTPNARLYTLKSEVSNRPCMMNVSAFAMAAMTQRTEKSHHDQAAMKCYNLNLLHVDIVPRSKPYLHHGMPMQLVTEANGHRTFTFWNHWFPTCVDRWCITVSREETISSSVCRNLCHHLPIPCVYPIVSTSNFHLEDPSEPCTIIVETTVCMQQTIDPGRWNGIKHEVFSDNFLIKHWTKSIDDM